MPVYVEPLSGYGFTPGVRTDLEMMAKRYNTEPPPMNMTEYEKYMVEYKINTKEMARQVRMDTSRTQSIASALRQAAEAATHHRFRTYWRVMGNTKVKRNKPNIELDIDGFIESGANPHVGTPKRVRETPGFQPVKWHWDVAYRRRLRSTDEELLAGWPTFDECVTASQLNRMEVWSARMARHILQTHWQTWGFELVPNKGRNEQLWQEIVLRGLQYFP